MSLPTRICRALWLGSVYAAAMVVSELLDRDSSGYINFWLPAGVLVAALLRSDRKDWPLVSGFIFAVNVGLDRWSGTSLSLSLGFAVANLASALVGVTLYRRFISTGARLTSLKELFGLIAFPVVCGTIVGATIGANVLVAEGARQSMRAAWINWWIGNAMAILQVAPFLLIWEVRKSADQAGSSAKTSRLELVAGVVLMTATAVRIFGFGDGISSPFRGTLLLFGLWAAVRMGRRGAAAINLAVGFLVTILVNHFHRGLSGAEISSGSYVVNLQVYFFLLSIVSLVPSVVLCERDVLFERLAEYAVMLRKAKEDDFRFLADAMPQIVWAANADGVVDYYNVRWFDYTGLTLQESMDGLWQSTIHPEDLDLCVARWREALSRGGPFETEFRIRKQSDQSYRWHLARAYPQRDRMGKIIRWAGTCTDIQEQKASVVDLEQRVEQRTAALMKSEELYRLMVTTVRDYAIFALDSTGRVASWNAGAERTKGYRAEEIIGQPYERFFPAENKRMATELLDKAARLGKAEDEGWRVRKDGTRFWATVVLTALYNSHGELTGYSKVTRDISLRKQLENNLKEHNESLEIETKRAQEASRLKTEFLANMSHELRTPLNAIIGFSSFLAGGKPGPLNPKQKEYLRDVLTSGQHLLRLINELLDLAKVEAGKFELNLAEIALADLIAEVSAVMAPLVQAKRIDFEMSIDSEVTLVRLDPQRIKQVLYNLLSNAIKFTNPGGNVRLIVATANEDEVEFRVVDSGIGIKPEDITRLFTEFQQLHHESPQLYPGTGLGLALTKKLVELHHGSIRVDSEVGVGSTFIVALPRGLEALSHAG